MDSLAALVAGKLGHEETTRNGLFAELTAEVGMNPADLPHTLGCIVDKAKRLVGCERGAVFLVDRTEEELYSVVHTDTGDKEIRIPMASGIAGHVVMSGEKIRVPNAYDCRYFNPTNDQKTGFRTRSVLCLPIKHRTSPKEPEVTIASIQLINKVGRSHEFTDADEADLQAFALLAGVFLWNSSVLMFKEWSGHEASQLIQNISNITTHAHTSQKGHVGKTRRGSIEGVDVSRYFAAPGRPNNEEMELMREVVDFDVMTYPIGSPEGDRLIPLVVTMFRDLGLCETFELGEEKLTRLALAVRARYRHIPYHNFNHAFDVAHTLYGFLTKGGTAVLLSERVRLSLFVAALFHDCDHHGLNNSFHLKAESPLSLLMKTTSGTENTSILEMHHCNVAVEVLSDPSVNVFSALNDEDRSKVWQDVIACILATDMHQHQEYCDRAKDSLSDDQGRAANPQLVMQMLLKAADVSNITKRFDISRRWGERVQQEFYLQGDREKEAGLEVSHQFDRSKKHELRQSQISFMRGLGIPFYTLIADIFPGTVYALQGVHENIQRWEEANSPTHG